MKYGNIPSINSFESVFNFLEKPWVVSSVFNHKTIILSYYHTIILSYYHTIILSYYHTIILSYYHTIILSYYHTIILSYYHTIILSYYHTIILSYYHTIILSYYHTIILSYYHTIILSYYHTTITIIKRRHRIKVFEGLISDGAFDVSYQNCQIFEIVNQQLLSNFFPSNEHARDFITTNYFKHGVICAFWKLHALENLRYVIYTRGTDDNTRYLFIYHHAI